MSLQNTLNNIAHPTVVLLGSIIILLVASTTGANPDTAVVHLNCSADTWAPHDRYGFLVADLLGELVAYTEQIPGYANYVSETIQGTGISCYGFAGCNTDLAAEDCYECLEAAQDALAVTCTYAVSAEVIMIDCSMRYSDSQP